MSGKSSRSGSLEARRPSRTGNNNPAVLLAKILTQSDYKALIGKLVSSLQDSSYSFIDLLRDAAGTKRKFVGTAIPAHQLASHWYQLVRIVEDCLARTLIAHEKFIDNRLHAFCEFDQSGSVTFANTKMLGWAANFWQRVRNTVQKQQAAN
jgi:hypothetical protein